MIDHLLAALGTLPTPPTAEEVADALWLAERIADADRARAPASHEARSDRRAPQPAPAGPPRDSGTAPDRSAPAPDRLSERPAGASPGAGVYLPPSRRQAGDAGRITPLRSPAVPALPGALAMSRALRPLRRYVGSAVHEVLDEDATASRIAASGLWLPVLRPAPERWLDLALVVDSGPSMVVWTQTVTELRALLERTGAFRDVRLWRMDTGQRDRVALRAASAPDGPTARSPRELVDPAGRRAVMVVTDCVGPAWSGEAAARALEAWGRAGATAILHLLPQRMWDRCAPRLSRVGLHGARPGLPNDRLDVRLPPHHQGPDPVGVPIPVLRAEARWLAPWAGLVAGTGPGPVSVTTLFTGVPADPQPPDSGGAEDTSPAVRVRRFRATASHTAFRLASLLAACPLSLPVMRLVQRAMLPESRPSHLAEVYLSDLLYRIAPEPGQPPDEVGFDFYPGVRELLLTHLRRSEALQVLDEVSRLVNARLGAGTPLDFRAVLATDTDARTIHRLGRPFAQVTTHVLRSLGGHYLPIAQRLTAEQEADPPGADPRPDGQTTPPDPQGGSDAAVADPRHPGVKVTISSTQTAAPQAHRHGLQPMVWGGVPPRNPNFTGRADLLAQLAERLSAGVTAVLPQALHGLGGVGKTQLALEYVYRSVGDYDLVWWIAAEQPALIRASLVELATKIGIPTSEDLNQTVQAVVDALRRGEPYARWLLVFDNADLPQDLIEFFPYGPGHVLVTSRNVSWTSVADTLEVDVFAREESVELLGRRGRGIDPAAAHQLAERLGDLPLALEQAAAWQAETGMPVEEYLRLFDERLGQLIETSYPPAVVTTWSLAFDRLREESPAAAQFLELCAFFGSEPIPGRLLPRGRLAALPRPLADIVRDEIKLRQAVRYIGRYALARSDPSRNTIQVHRLIQAILRDQMSPEQRETYRRGVHELLAAANPGQPEDTSTWPVHRELRPHVLPTHLVDAATSDARKVVLDQICYLYTIGDLTSARELGELAVHRWRQTLGRDDEQTLVATRHLATALWLLGRTEESRALSTDTLERFRRVFGDDHPHTLATADLIAADLRLQGRLDEALELDRDTLARNQRVFGEDDPLTIRTAHNLAVNLRLRGDFQAAREMDEATVRQRIRVQGHDHPFTYFTRSNLACDLFGLGDYAGARRMLEDIVPAYRARLGEDHPDVLRASRNLAMALRKTGAHDQARELAERNVELCHVRLGPEHLDTLAASSILSNTLRVAGQAERGLSLAQTTLEKYQRLFGPEHRLTHVCAANLAILLRATGRLAEARELNTSTLEKMRELMGEDHPFTLCCAANLASDLHQLGDHQAALDLSRQTLEKSRARRGENHPYTLACAANLALDLRATGDLAAAQELHERTMVRYQQTLGEHNPDTVRALRGQRVDCDIDTPAV